jgi:hypothetical protein
MRFQICHSGLQDRSLLGSYGEVGVIQGVPELGDQFQAIAWAELSGFLKKD